MRGSALRDGTQVNKNNKHTVSISERTSHSASLPLHSFLYFYFHVRHERGRERDRARATSLRSDKGLALRDVTIQLSSDQECMEALTENKTELTTMRAAYTAYVQGSSWYSCCVSYADNTVYWVVATYYMLH